MTLPEGWHGAGITKESGQSWVYQVSRSGDSSIYALKRLKNPARRDALVELRHGNVKFFSRAIEDEEFRRFIADNLRPEVYRRQRRAS